MKWENKMIKNIIFDLSEVIISGYHLEVVELIEQNTNIAGEMFLERKLETLDVFLDAMRGKYSEDEYVEKLLEGTDWNFDKETFKKLIRQGLNIAVKGTMEIVKKLKKQYHLILLSDHMREWVEFILENNAELNIFEHQYFSYDYGLLKTDEGCFDYILKDLKIKSEETIFIDDSKENVAMARKSGIDGIVFQSAEDLERELRERKIL